VVCLLLVREVIRHRTAASPASTSRIAPAAPADSPPSISSTPAAPNNVPAATPASQPHPPPDPFDAYLRWVRVQEQNRALLRDILHDLADSIEKSGVRQHAGTPSGAAEMEKQFSAVRPRVDKTLHDWNESIRTGLDQGVPRELRLFHEQYSLVLKRERLEYRAAGLALLGDTSAEKARPEGSTPMLALQANSTLQLAQLGQGMMNGRVRLDTSEMAP
jgi:hypothetical protein